MRDDLTWLDLPSQTSPTPSPHPISSPSPTPHFALPTTAATAPTAPTRAGHSCSCDLGLRLGWTATAPCTCILHCHLPSLFPVLGHLSSFSTLSSSVLRPPPPPLPPTTTTYPPTFAPAHPHPQPHPPTLEMPIASPGLPARPPASASTPPFSTNRHALLVPLTIRTITAAAGP